MLGFWRCHNDYQQFVTCELSNVAHIDPSALLEYETEISKLYILDLDSLKNNLVLHTICGFSEKMPPLALYYDFINRIVKT